MIKRGIYITSSFVILSIIIAYLLFYLKPIKAFNFETSQLKNGDLILRCGRSTESFAVYTADKNAEFTHIGIIVYENNIPKVIHAVPHKNKFIKRETLNTFLKPENASKFAIYRSNYSVETLKNVTNKAVDFYNKKVQFDSNYDLNTNEEMYCTELILKAYKNANIQLNIKPKELYYLFGKHPVIFPSAFTELPFEKVKINK